jgi:hypothetical protein
VGPVGGLVEPISRRLELDGIDTGFALAREIDESEFPILVEQVKASVIKR